MLSPEEIEKIKEQESIRHQLHRELTPEKRQGLWELLNSQFVLWLLGSVLLSGITYYWNYRNDQRVSQEKKLEKEIVEQREDSQFLVLLLSYLTNSDRTVRLRAVDVIKTRYPEDKLPPAIQRLVANTIVEENSLPNTQQSEETKRLVSNAVRVLDKLSQPDPAVAATIQQLPVRVYLQIFDEQQREKAQEIQTKLRQEGFLVPGIENVSEKVPKSVKRTDVRFFNDSDADVANHVRDILIRNGFQTVDVLHPKIKANPRTLEIWFATAD